MNISYKKILFISVFSFTVFSLCTVTALGREVLQPHRHHNHSGNHNSTTENDQPKVAIETRDHHHGPHHNHSGNHSSTSGNGSSNITIETRDHHHGPHHNHSGNHSSTSGNGPSNITIETRDHHHGPQQNHSGNHSSAENAHTHITRDGRHHGHRHHDCSNHTLNTTELTNQTESNGKREMGKRSRHHHHHHHCHNHNRTTISPNSSTTLNQTATSPTSNTTSQQNTTSSPIAGRGIDRRHQHGHKHHGQNHTTSTTPRQTTDAVKREIRYPQPLPINGQELNGKNRGNGESGRQD